MSNYLLQSLVCTTLFYGYGLNLYGKLSPLQLVLCAITLFALQLAGSAAWLQRYAYGPVEWLVRSWTYLQKLPQMRQ